MAGELESDERPPGEGTRPGQIPVRVFISYAHDDDAHVDRVRDFWLFLRAHGVDARLDLTAAERRVDWAQWMTQEIRDADRVLVVASPDYKRRADGDAEASEGRGVQWEAGIIRDVLYADQEAGLARVLPVVLPGCTGDDIPLWLRPASTTRYEVSDYTTAGAELLLRVLTAQPRETVPVLGRVPDLPPRGTPGPAPLPVAAPRPGLRTEIMIEAAASPEGGLASAVWVAGSLLGQRQGPLPAEVTGVWEALRLPDLVAGERLAEAGRKLAGALMDEDAQRILATLLTSLHPGDTAEVVLAADAAALSLPAELIRLADGGAGTEPLALLPAVAVSRRLAGPDLIPGRAAPARAVAPPAIAGPLKILAAVAAPDETKTRNAPLDAEAEMAAVLDTVRDAAGDAGTQVKILEVASLPAIRDALERDAYHVLHLSAHGSPDSIELEDEDGGPVQVTPEALMNALRHAGRPVPLIVLSSCSGGSAGSRAMAAGLTGRGADRVIAMLAPVSDDYATTLARHLYHELSSRPGLTVGQALARARYLAEEERSGGDGTRVAAPEYGVAALFATAGDAPLVDLGSALVPLTAVTTPPAGRLVRDLPMGTLIGRRAELRTATAILRRTPQAVRHFGAASGVQLTGIGGIGKTAAAGRVMSRLRDDGWICAVHEGSWHPAALITSVAEAVSEVLPRTADPATAAALRGALARLTDPDSDDSAQLNVITAMLASIRLLVVFDDFEQNLTPGGEAFFDPSTDDIITELADAAETGALLLTCRYPLPGPDRFLARIPLPALSPAELRRLFLRLPALNDLDAADQQLLTRTIGGHPRLIEFTDALLRGGHASLRHIQARLRTLARQEDIDLHASQSPGAAASQAMLLGGADILITELLRLLTPVQRQALTQIAVSRAPMTPDDLAFALAPDSGPAVTAIGAPPSEAQLRSDVERLTDLTLLLPGREIAMHPWTADLAARNLATDLEDQHERALAMRFRRFDQGRGSYADLLDIPLHLASLRRYDDIPAVATQVLSLLSGTLASVAYLAEVRPLIPDAERAWSLVADMEAGVLLNAGNLPAATRQLHAIRRQDENRTAADPANTQWQRDLSISHDNLGDVAVAAGDLAAARTSYQASLDIRARLAAADPANTQWQRDLAFIRQRLSDLPGM